MITLDGLREDFLRKGCQGRLFLKVGHARLRVGLRQRRFVASNQVHSMKFPGGENRVSGLSQSLLNLVHARGHQAQYD